MATNYEEQIMRDVPADAVRTVEETLRNLGTRAVFGEPVSHEGVMVIPVAEVRIGLGFGSGRGPMYARAQSGTSGEGTGGGGGGGGRVKPRGFIRIAGDSVTYEPIHDITLMTLAGMFFATLSLIFFFRTLK